MVSKTWKESQSEILMHLNLKPENFKPQEVKSVTHKTKGIVIFIWKVNNLKNRIYMNKN